MKTDSLFYKLFQQTPQLVLELAGLEQTGEENYQFRSEEIKQTAFRLDGVLIPPPERVDLSIYFIEVQFQPQPTFWSRFFSEIFLYLHRNQPAHPWRSIVIFPSRSVEMSGELHYSALLKSNQVQRIYLEDLIGKQSQNARVRLVQLIVEDENRVPNAAQSLIEEIESGKLEVDNKSQILEMVETILVYKFPKLGREEVQKMLGYNDISLKQTQFYQDVYAEGQHEGILKGTLNGILKGRQEGEANLIIRLLVRRFGKISGDLQNRVRLLTVDQLEELSESLLDFTTLDDMEKWLELIDS